MNAFKESTGGTAPTNAGQPANEQQGAMGDLLGASNPIINNEGEDKLDYRVTPLGDENYITWKWQVAMILKTKGLYECITEEHRGTASQRGRAATFLASTLSQDNMRRVINCESAYQIWTTLEANFENKSSTERTMLLEKFTSAKIQSIRSISKDIGEIQALAAKLRNLGVSIDDEFIISIILKALPESLKTWKSTWKIVNAKEPSLNNLISSIFAEVSEMRLPQDTALVARKKPWQENPGFEKPLYRGYSKSSTSTKKNGPDKSKERACYYCNKSGHWIAECRKRIADEKGDKDNGVAMMALETDTHTNLWIADSGSSFHMTPNQDWIMWYKELSTERQITLGDNRQIPAKGVGCIKTDFGVLTNVHYVPELSNSLFSVSAAANKGIEARYDNKGIKLLKNGQVILAGPREHGTYWLNIKITKNFAVPATLKEWHDRLGHIAPKTIERMAKLKIVDGLEIKAGSEESSCVNCGLAKCSHVSHPGKTTTRVNKPGVSLHFDTVGPSKIESLGGSKYILLCKDEASGYRLVSMMSTKSQIPDQLKQIISKAEVQTGNKVLQIRTDNGSEFLNTTTKEFLNNKGINHITSTAYTPQQNGLIERDIRTVVESARTMLLASGLPPELWAEAIDTAVYVLNRTINTADTIRTPYELWFGKKPNLKNIHRFGQQAIVKYSKDMGSKWDPKGSIQKFIGYTDTHNTFKFFDELSSSIYRSCDVIFTDIETSDTEKQTERDWTKGDRVLLSKIVPTRESGDINDTSMYKYGEMEWDDESVIFHDINSEMEEDPLNLMTTSNLDEESTEVCSTTPTIGTDIQQDIDELDADEKKKRKYNKLDRMKRLSERLGPSDIHPAHIVTSKLRPTTPKDYTETYHAKLARLEIDEDPRSVTEAMNRQDKKNWLQAMQEEMSSLKKNDVYTLVDRPNGNIVTNKWVFKVKRRPDGTIDRYKARLVARGFSQVHGIDYLETYAPVANMTSIRLLLAYAAVEKLEMAQFDVKTAFLYGELNETVYMEQPEGFCEDKNKVCLLKRSLYGLKQSPRQWNIKFSQFLKDMNLQVSQNDECIFYRKDPLLVIAIYVDDGLIFSRSEKEISKIIKQLSERFDIHLEEATTFLGFQVHRGTNGEMALHQTSYIQTILKRFNMENSKPVDSPISPTNNSNNDLEPLDKSVPYREAIGSLMYAAVITRVDIAHAVSKASRHVQNPTNQDWVAVKRIFRYLKGKESYSLVYRSTNDKQLTVYCDADFAGDEDTSRSTTGSVFLYGGAPILWKSQRQPLITLSSTEAEFVSMCSTVKEVIWLRKLGQELNIWSAKPTIILCDNESAIKIATNEKSIHRTRHMSVQASYPREKVEEGEIDIRHISAENQLADMLTKPTTVTKFVKNASRLMQTTLKTVCLLFLLSFGLHPVLANSSFKFERALFIQLVPTDIEVEVGTTRYDLELTYTSPCNIYLHEGLEEKYMVGKHNQIKLIRQKCHEFYKEAWEAKMRELIYIKPTNKDAYETNNSKVLLRKKRFVPFLFVVGAVMVVSAVTNLLWAGASEILPWGDGYRLRNQQNQIDLERDRINNLDKLMRQNTEMIKVIKAELSNVEKEVQANSANIEKIGATLPNIIWIGPYVQNAINKASEHLETVRLLYMNGRAATHDIHEIWNVTQIRNISPEDTYVEKIERISENTILFRMYVRNRAKDTKVYRIVAFEPMSKRDGIVTLAKYVGPNHIIMNSTNECRKFINLEPGTKRILTQCQRHTDKIHFDVVRQPMMDQRAAPLPVVKQIGTFNYIYCEGYNITIDDHVVDCPNYVFKLPSIRSFSTMNHNHIGTEHIVSIEKVWKPMNLEIEQNAPPTFDQLKFQDLEFQGASPPETTKQADQYTLLIISGAMLMITLAICTIVITLFIIKKYKTDGLQNQTEHQGQIPLIRQPVTRISQYDPIYNEPSEISDISNHRITRVRLMSKEIPLTKMQEQPQKDDNRTN